MSTILNALKKLEKDSEASGFPEALPGEAEVFRAGGKRSSAWFYIALAVLLAFAGGGFSAAVFTGIFKEEPSGELSLSKENYQVKDRENITEGKPQAQEKEPPVSGSTGPDAPEAEKKVSRAGKKDKGGAADAGPQHSAGPAEAAASPEPGASGEAQPEEEMGKAVTASADEAQEEPLPRKNMKTSVPEADPEARIQGSTRALKGTGLTIQAISWDNDPQKRIAVINSTLCREGDRINGYLILRINPDDIVVSDGGKSGRLGF